MKTEIANKSSELVLAQLILLLQQDCTRQEIIEQIPAYRRGASPDAQCKMLDRDFSTLERVGCPDQQTRVTGGIVLSNAQQSI